MDWIKVKKKPVEVEVFQLTEKLWDRMRRKEEKIEINGRFVWSILVNNLHKHFGVRTLEGDMEAKIGDYIIKGVKGEIYPCRKDIFEETYEEVR